MVPSIFISHTSHDDAFAQRIADALVKKGASVWIDHDQIRAGDHFVAKIEEGLKAATHVLILLSPYSILSDWVHEERHAAHICAVKGAKRVIPVFLPGFLLEDMPLFLQSYVYIDFNDPSFDAVLEKLWQDIGAHELSDAETDVQGPQIEEISWLAKRGSDAFALEAFISNAGRFAHSVRTATIRSWNFPNYNIAYWNPPETRTFHLALKAAATTDSELRIAGGVIEHPDDWARPIQGKIIIEAYEKVSVDFSFPLFAELKPNDTGLLRFVFDPIEIDAKAGVIGGKALSRERGGTFRILTPPADCRPGHTSLILRTSKDLRIAAAIPGTFAHFLYPGSPS